MAPRKRSYAPLVGQEVDETKSPQPERRQGEGTSGADAGGGYDDNGVKSDPLSWEDEKLTKHLWQLWADQDGPMQPREARWKANKKRRAGVVGVQVIRDDNDRAKWVVYAPPGTARVPPTFNKAARLCRRLVSNLMVDPPVPECEPGAYAENTDPDGAEFSTRIMQSVTGPAGINLPKQMRRALNKACTFDSGFIWFKVDPQGGGQRPKSILASPAARTIDDAVFTIGATGGRVPQPRPYVTRYVAEDGQTLTDEPGQAVKEWLPRIKSEIITGMNFRFVPETATDIDEADGGLILTFQPIGVLKKLFPAAFDKLTPDDLNNMVSHRPQGSEDRSPSHIKDPKSTTGEGEGPPDDAMVATLTAYFVRCPSYPNGGYFVLGGEKIVLHRQKWVSDQRGREIELPIPVAQFKGFEEGEDDPYGRHLMWLLGSGNEARASIVGTAIEHLYRFNSAKTFYTPSTLFQPKQGQILGPYVAVQEGTEPKREKLEQYPTMGMDLFDRTSLEMDDEASLMPAAQGAHEAGVDSGLHAQKLIEQVNVNLSDIRQATEDGFIRSCDIIQVLIQAFYTTPMKVRVVGDDNEYKYEEFSGADLSGDFDIKIQKGTMTMLAPSAKLALAEHGYALGMLDTEELKRIWSGNVGGSLGVQDYPPLVRVRGQIQAFLKGPPEGTLPEEWPAAAASIWQRLPNDLEPSLPVTDMKGQPGARPGIAMLRFIEISRAMQTAKFRKQPPEWQAAMEAEYVEMGMAAGVPLHPSITGIDPMTGLPPGEVPPPVEEPGALPAEGQPVASQAGAVPAGAGAVEPLPGAAGAEPPLAPMDAGISGVPAVNGGVAPVPPVDPLASAAQLLAAVPQAPQPIVNVQPPVTQERPRPAYLRLVPQENGEKVIIPVYDEAEEVPA